MDNVSQLSAVGEYGLAEGASAQLEKLIPGRATRGPVRNGAGRRSSATSEKKRKQARGAAFGGLTYDTASPKNQSHVIVFSIKSVATQAPAAISVS